MPVVSGVNTITDGLIFYVDPTNTNTYSGVGTTAYNLIPGGINNFSLVNGVAYDLDRSGSFYFDGSNDYVGLGSTTIFNSTAFTVSFWIKPTTFSGTYCSGAVSNGQYTIFGTSSSYQGYSSTFSGAIQTAINGNAIATVNQSNFSINKWYHYVAVYDSAGTGNSTKFKIYIDGVIKSLTFDANMPSAPYAAGQEARIGWGPGGGAYPYYNGNIGLVQIHSKALSSTEILQNYNATKARFNTTENIVTDNLIMYIDPGKASSYPGTGTSIYDLSPTGNTGTLINGPSFSSINGGSLVFDGSNDYIVMPSNSAYNLANGSFTVELFCSITNPIIGERMILEHNNWPAAGLYQFTFADTDYFRVNFPEAFTPGRQELDYLETPLALNKWMHLIGQFDTNTNTFRIYINGVLKAQRTDVTAELGSSTSNIYILCRNGTGLFTAAKLGFIRLYNRSLTFSEITQNYNATKSRYINVLPPVNDSLVLNLDAGNRASYAGTGTTWFDLTSFGAKATLINSPVFAGSGTSTYFSFDGTDDYMTLPSSNNWAVAQTATIEMWVYAENTNTNARLWCVTNNGASLDAYIKSDTTLGFHGETCTVSSFPMSQWVHLVVVYTSGTISVYFNGVSKTVNGATTGYNISQTGTLYIGQYAGGGSYYHKGRIATFRIYKGKALTSTEILQNFNSVRSRYNI